ISIQGFGRTDDGLTIPFPILYICTIPSGIDLFITTNINNNNNYNILYIYNNQSNPIITVINNPTFTIVLQ
ncbi:hypothetical protein SAMD00019534_123070, partial [Acytostelium subglobosum LB1]|uniref:hypothetical protein n=1 Tax=Acytostelium subglobosum LB1 TaxID=1410327 RepID=UPI000645149E